MQDDAGAVTGATCKLGWEKGSRTALAVSRAISQFGVAHADSAGEAATQAGFPASAPGWLSLPCAALKTGTASTK